MAPPFDLLPALLRGAGLTVALTLAAGLLGLVLSFVVGLARLSPARPIRAITTSYVELFRGTSALVQLFLFFYVLPRFGLELPALLTGALALGLNTGAYGSEIVRGAILAVDKGQREAATALNLRPATAMRRIILPQALPAMLPPFGNLLVELLKGTSLVSLITLTELAFAGRQLAVGVGRVGEVYALVLILYFVLTYPIMLVTRRIERRVQRHDVPFRPA